MFRELVWNLLNNGPKYFVSLYFYQTSPYIFFLHSAVPKRAERSPDGSNRAAHVYPKRQRPYNRGLLRVRNLRIEQEEQENNASVVSHGFSTRPWYNSGRVDDSPTLDTI